MIDDKDWNIPENNPYKKLTSVSRLFGGGMDELLIGVCGIKGMKTSEELTVFSLDIGRAKHMAEEILSFLKDLDDCS